MMALGALLGLWSFVCLGLESSGTERRAEKAARGFPVKTTNEQAYEAEEVFSGSPSNAGPDDDEINEIIKAK